MKIKKGDKLPDAKVFILEKDPKEVSIKEIVGDEKVILFGLPGAFTPTCSTKHLPGFVIAIDQLKKKGIKKVVCISVTLSLSLSLLSLARVSARPCPARRSGPAAACRDEAHARRPSRARRRIAAAVALQASLRGRGVNFLRSFELSSSEIIANC